MNMAQSGQRKRGPVSYRMFVQFFSIKILSQSRNVICCLFQSLNLICTFIGEIYNRSFSITGKTCSSHCVMTKFGVDDDKLTFGACFNKNLKLPLAPLAVVITITAAPKDLYPGTFLTYRVAYCKGSFINFKPNIFTLKSYHRCGRVVTLLPLNQRPLVRSPVGSVFLIEVFSGVFPQP